MKEIILDTVMDSARLIPFLFITYFLMEWIEHRTSHMTQEMIERSGRFGPVIGSFLGAFPQCGFSAAGSSLYAGRIITLGTLFSIYLSTSDEMLPIMISEAVPLNTILKILGIKIVMGMTAGIGVDFIMSLKPKKIEGHIQINKMCDHDHCHCEKGILHSALYHTMQVTFFIFLISFLLNLCLATVGENVLSGLISNYRFFSEFFAALIGLIPNCAASVMITQLYMEGVLNFGGLISGLLTGAGIGLLVLFRVNHPMKENLKIVGALYGIGVIFGILVNLAGISI